MIDFKSYEEVGAWAHRHGIDALRALLRREQMRSNSQSLAAIWLTRLEGNPGIGGIPPQAARHAPRAGERRDLRVAGLND